MWPTDTTLYLLLLGAVILCNEMRRVVRLGLQEVLSMRFCGVAFLWIGYHLSPWLAYLGNDWDDLLLVPALLDRGLLFSLLCMAAFVFGHWCVMGGRPTWAQPWGHGLIASYRVSAGMLFGAVGLSVLLFVITVGGIGEVWQSSMGRGAGQFIERDMLGRIVQMLTIMQAVISIVGACLASLFLLAQRPSTLRMLGGSMALIAFSLAHMYSFSRGAGFAFLILALVAIYLKRLRGMPIVMVAIPLALFLGSVGYHQRGNFNPGIGNFLEAVPRAVEEMVPNEQRVMVGEPEPVINTLDSMSVWTRVAAIADDYKPDRLTHGVDLLLSLSPLPSELVWVAGVGPDLVAIMGTGTSMGITTPALAQIYYALGSGGAVVMVVIGAIYGWFDRLRVVQPGGISLLCSIMCLASLAIGLHSVLRAMTRPLIYAFIMFRGYSWFASQYHPITQQAPSPNAAGEQVGAGPGA
jgi:hypothetical protein